VEDAGPRMLGGRDGPSTSSGQQSIPPRTWKDRPPAVSSLGEMSVVMVAGR
jgi:hypothetical protein